MSLVGLCGSRSLPPSFAPLVGRVVRLLAASGRPLAVGCAPGADALVRAASPAGASLSVLRASSFGGGSPRSSLARRSAALVAALSAAGPGSALVGFVLAPCPAGLLPSASPARCFSGRGSGSWASLALAAGLGLPVVVFPLASPAAAPPALPASWGGSWAPCSGAFAGGFRFVPAPAPASLF